MRVAAIQSDIVWADRDANFAALRPLIADAVAQGAELVLLTEMFSTGFVVDRSDIGEQENGPSSQFLSEMSRTHEIWIGGSARQHAHHWRGRSQRGRDVGGRGGTVIAQHDPVLVGFIEVHDPVAIGVGEQGEGDTKWWFGCADAKGHGGAVGAEAAENRARRRAVPPAG